MERQSMTISWQFIALVKSKPIIDKEPKIIPSQTILPIAHLDCISIFLSARLPHFLNRPEWNSVPVCPLKDGPADSRNTL